jgi:CRISPR-associated protein Cas2
MYLVATYDVNTETPEGKARLRKMANLCKAYGQRVQLSVFELTITETQKERFTAQAAKIMDPKKDGLRIYRLIGDREKCVECLGINTYKSFEDPLII